MKGWSRTSMFVVIRFAASASVRAAQGKERLGLFEIPAQEKERLGLFKVQHKVQAAAYQQETLETVSNLPGTTDTNTKMPVYEFDLQLAYSPIMMFSTPMMSYCSRMAFRRLMCSEVETSTLPARWPHFFVAAKITRQRVLLDVTTILQCSLNTVSTA